MKKTCSKCKATIKFDSKILMSGGSYSYKLSNKTVAISGKCSSCVKTYRAKLFKKTKGMAYKKYEKTMSGFLMRLFRNIKSRSIGIQKRKYHLYANKGLFFSKEEFYEWANSSAEFKKLFNLWEKSEYDRKLTPSVDRINSSIGYSFSNIRWVTHSENSRLGSLSRHSKKLRTIPLSSAPSSAL